LDVYIINGGLGRWKKKIIYVYFQSVLSVRKDIYCLSHIRMMFLRNGNVLNVDLLYRKETIVEGKFNRDILEEKAF
tara:strand:- start:75 stop:302 length:228 start_codon:yes stop_codon:yes gene_type:complete